MGDALSRRAILLADAAPGAGLGHLARSTGLAQALADEGISTACIALGADAPLKRGSVDWAPASDLASIGQGPVPGDVAVVDSYTMGAGEARRWAHEAALAAFWDLGEPPDADLLISVALEIPDGVHGLQGPEYACLVRDFWQPPARRIGDTVERVLVAAGGADPTEAALGFCDAARRTLAGAEVVLVQGPQSGGPAPPGVLVLRAPASLRDPLLEADLVVAAAGQTMLEALASGTPCIAVPVVDNQRPGAELLAEMGAVELAEPDDPERLQRTIAALADDPGRRGVLSARGMECVDGRGAQRVAKELATPAR